MGRSNWKGPYINMKLLEHVDLMKKKGTAMNMSRNSEIIPEFFGHTFKVHNGRGYTEMTVTEEMMGHKFGEFSPTRAKFIFKKKKKKK